MWKMGWKGFRGWNMKMFFSVLKLNAGGAYWHNGLCIQIMEALCHIYGFAYVLPLDHCFAKNYENFVVWDLPR